MNIFIHQVCPIPGLIASFAEGARAALLKLAPKLIGQNPLEIETIYARMEKELQGHEYAKAPIDIALWDILGKVMAVS